jgi:hypothetical protein
MSLIVTDTANLLAQNSYKYLGGCIVATIECPFCYEILEIDPPDRLHTAFSLVKPMRESYHGKIVKKNHKCQKSDCERSIAVYWYAPLEYFTRI